MSNCANIINRLTRELCHVQNHMAKFDCMHGVLVLNQDIIQHLNKTAYIVPDDSAHSSHCGIPLQVKKTYNGSETTYDGLLVEKTTDGNSILVSTSNLYNYTKRQCTGFVCFTSCLPLCVEKIDVKVLETLDSVTVTRILQECSNTKCKGTLTLEEYNILLAFLHPYGVREIGIQQAACFYKTAMRLNKSDSGSSLDDHVVSAVSVEPAEPNEPNEPNEPSDVPLELNVRHVRQVDDNTATTSNITLTNEAIEAKLKALLESTETESTS